MRKYLFLLAAIAVLISCSDKNEPKQMQKVTFNVSGLQVETTQMNAPRKAPILDDEGGTALTDIYLFDGTTQIAHQNNTTDASTFGTIEVQLELGQHHLHFVATRSTGITYNAGVMSFGSIRPTFGKHLDLDITGATVSESVQLSRITGQLIINIEDAIPNDLDSIAFTIATKYNAFNVTTFNGANGAESRIAVNVTSKRGKENQEFTFNVLSATYGDSYTTTVTITSYKHNGTQYVRVVENVPIASNTKTTLHGELYKGATSSITVNTEWNDPIEGNM